MKLCFAKNAAITYAGHTDGKRNAMAKAHSSPLSAPPHQNLDDAKLASWLDTLDRSKRRVALLHSNFLCKLVDLEDPTATMYLADPQSLAKKALKKIAGKKRLVHLEMPFDELDAGRTASDTWPYTPWAKEDVDAFINGREGMLSRTEGRGDPIDDKTAQRVWADAGGRCMFEGCAEDLSAISLWTKATRVGYLAHIIASDPKGPRGTQEGSHLRSNDPENIMLMCDAHHRLIDSFAPSIFTADVLFAMRKAHREMVRSYLDALAFPRTHAVTLHANLANIPTYFHDSEFIDAILATRRAMMPGVIHYIRRTSQRDDRNTPGFWGHYLREHESEIRRLVTGFNSASASSTQNLAVFPLHHVPTMVLAGRIMGEAQDIQVFQYSRNKRTWAWDASAIGKVPGTFQLNLPQSQASEVLVSLELTATVDAGSLPAELKPKIDEGCLPWIRITLPAPSFDCIGHPDDLEQFGRIARQAINHVQDVMRAEKVHLIAISPASTIFRFGQMLQAGHHPEYVVYDRAGRDDLFVPALSITGHAVSAPSCESKFSISLR